MNKVLFYCLKKKKKKNNNNNNNNDNNNDNNKYPLLALATDTKVNLLF